MKLKYISKQTKSKNKMATNSPTIVPTNPMAQFDSVATRIHQTFDPLIAQLIARRDALLLELSQLREDYSNKETTRRAAIQEIETAQQQMLMLSIKENIGIRVHQQAADAYKQGLQQLETPTKLPCPHFTCPTLYKLESLIAEFGEVKDWEVPDYPLKREPVLTAGKWGTGSKEFKARGLTIDESNELIYLADHENKRVQIVSFKGDFIKRFGQDKLKEPWGIAITSEHIYVTDRELHALFQFNKNSFQLLNKTGTKGQTDGQFNTPTGLCTDYSGDVFVADSDNNRVCIFSYDLKFISKLGMGQLNNPRDVKLTPDCQVVVLDSSPKCVHFYSRNGHLLSSCVSRGKGPKYLVSTPFFLCMDIAGNIILSDWDNHSIKIISKSGHLIHTIGKKGHGIGEFVYPTGISVSKSGVIFVVSYNANFSIQCF